MSLVMRLPVVNMGPLRKTRYSHLARLCPEHRPFEFKPKLDDLVDIGLVHGFLRGISSVVDA